MEKPVVAANEPIAVELKKGKTYLYCTCGRSKDQPFCDGSHQGSGFSPQSFTANSDGETWLCRCKQTGHAPYCDGSHAQVPAELVGQNVSLTSATKSPEEPEDQDPTRPDQDPDQDLMPEPHPTAEEPALTLIHELAEHGLEHVGPQGPIAAMGVPRRELPNWDHLQILVAQLARQPLQNDAPVATELVLGPQAAKPLHLRIPLFVSDMSFGALSEEAKVSLARGAEQAGTGICSGEGGMLPEEKAANSRYLYELAPGRFGYREELLEQVQAFHFKCGQAAKTGAGGHLPGIKTTARIAALRGVPVGEPVISPPTFTDLSTVDDFRRFADRVREISGGIPVGFKISAQHIEADLDFAIDAGADYIILDGRGGGTGAAPLLFRDHISVPTIPALARARRHLDRREASGRVTLIITGGLRTHADCIKAMALGADGIALANASIQAIGCVGARLCHTNNCPAGIATQDAELRRRLNIDHASDRLARFFEATVALMQVMARACGHTTLQGFNRNDLTSWHRDLAELAGIAWCGVEPERPPGTNS
ncbi:glutamate synthase-related protein [Synechococcus sp. RedBA-s]|uniref:glutamate synthase-related protein n=1 Tax=Synechococcus sp. RedBA-s TaxID=2823741 RepID=UPI0020CFDA77|nr:glutamate synthase-related protein [Synechococcus sp. RedBA-s]MCP9801212.1 CDGSH iron-sulfur domain-containing protein [Synechococcus sp. RedBA-s]